MIHKLSNLIKEIGALEVIGDTDKNIHSLEADSRKVQKQGMFVAVRGVNTDGHKYIPVVASNNVGAIVCEELPPAIRTGVTYIRVADSAEALGRLASAWYGHPSSSLSLVGVTGTNGKTTTATLLYEMARNLGYRAGLLSTVCNYVDGEAIPTTHTTPDPLTLNSLLARMVEAGCDYAFMEVSSHACSQKRIAGLRFKGGIFSNLTRDHLDYHGTVQNYLNAKKKFFDALPADAFALTNADDKTGAVMLQNTAARRATYSLQKMADFRGRVIEERLDGMALSLNDKEINVMFTGRFNAYNLTAVYGACCLLGWNPEEVLVNMSRLVPVAGRFQTFHSADGVTAIVDYAHTPDAVVNVLNAIRDVLGSKGSILTVVGAGGNRDKGKRPIMAQEAARLSQRVLLTSDNPRFEEPEAILRDMEAGLAGNPEWLEKTVSITDRRTAIDTAVRQAMPGDVILIAGKGHEDYQEIRGVKHHFDDREEVRRALTELR